MAEPSNPVDWRVEYADIFEEPDISDIEVEDGKPVDSLFAEKQHRLLIESLHTNWKPKEKFVAATNVGVFFAVSQPPVVPDAFISFGVEPPTFEQLQQHKKYRAYFIWVYGKPPDVVVEVVSNRKGDELSFKLRKYAEIRVSYYVVYDWLKLYGEPRLRLFKLSGSTYIEKPDLIIDAFGLQVGLRNGAYQSVNGEWLRWFDKDGNLLLSNEESSEQAAMTNLLVQQRAEAERERAEKLAAKLRALGVNPDDEF